jgi:hypothetical protein
LGFIEGSFWPSFILEDFSTNSTQHSFAHYTAHSTQAHNTQAHNTLEAHKTQAHSTQAHNTQAHKSLSNPNTQSQQVFLRIICIFHFYLDLYIGTIDRPLEND